MLQYINMIKQYSINEFYSGFRCFFGMNLKESIREMSDAASEINLAIDKFNFQFEKLGFFNK